MLIEISPSRSLCHTGIYSRKVFHNFIQFISFSLFHFAVLSCKDLTEKMHLFPLEEIITFLSSLWQIPTKLKTSALATGFSNICINGARDRTPEECRSLSTTDRVPTPESTCCSWLLEKTLQQIPTCLINIGDPVVPLKINVPSASAIMQPCCRVLMK